MKVNEAILRMTHDGSRGQFRPQHALINTFQGTCDMRAVLGFLSRCRAP